MVVWRLMNERERCRRYKLFGRISSYSSILLLIGLLASKAELQYFDRVNIPTSVFVILGLVVAFTLACRWYLSDDALPEFDPKPVRSDQGPDFDSLLDRNDSQGGGGAHDGGSFDD